MDVKLLSYSQAPDFVAVMPEPSSWSSNVKPTPSLLDLVAYCARVSNPEN